jgi:phospholipase C
MMSRSFDHLLGHLSLNEYGLERVDGLRDDPKWLKAVANPNPKDQFRFEPFHLTYFGIHPAPCEREDVALQLGRVQSDGRFAMDGFIASAGGDSSVMGYYESADVPVTAFFAKHFAVCDRWFAPLPASSQPNRLMAMSGYSLIDRTQNKLLPKQELVYDWLDAHRISWRVYSEGFPFFAMMSSVQRRIISDSRDQSFCGLRRLKPDFAGDAALPQVIFVEPGYTDGMSKSPCDDKPPTSVLSGQRFLLNVYEALTANPARWSRTLLIITYDQHGGFFDHVSPPPIVTRAPSGEYPDFKSAGLRVPAIIVSPLVRGGSIFNGVLDHTSILRLLADKFGGQQYSREVDDRPVGSVTELLDLPEPRKEIPVPPRLDDIPATTEPPLERLVQERPSVIWKMARWIMGRDA